MDSSPPFHLIPQHLHLSSSGQGVLPYNGVGHLNLFTNYHSQITTFGSMANTETFESTASASYELQPVELQQRLHNGGHSRGG